LTYITTTSI